MQFASQWTEVYGGNACRRKMQNLALLYIKLNYGHNVFLKLAIHEFITITGIVIIKFSFLDEDIKNRKKQH